MKKLNRILSLSAAAALALSLTVRSAPSGTADTPAGGSSNTPAAGETYKVAVIKQTDHASLDDRQRDYRPAGRHRGGKRHHDRV